MTATATFSIEIELGWGLVRSNQLGKISPMRRAETRSLERLLSLFEELDIAITFNIVGHLMLDERPESSHQSHSAEVLNRIRSTDSKENRLFYAPDLVDKIRESSVDHEICTHTFTHVECAEVSEERLRWEFERVFETHEEHGLDRPVSLVPPRHSPPPRDVLKDFDIGIVRAPHAHLPSAREPPTRAHLAKDILTGEQPIAPPRLVDDVVETYCTRYPSLTAPFLPMGQTSPHAVFQKIPVAVRKWLHARNLRSNLSTAIKRGSYIHLWTHLWDTANEFQWPLIEQFFREVDKERKSGRLNTRTMCELNEKIHSL